VAAIVDALYLQIITASTHRASSIHVAEAAFRAARGGSMWEAVRFR
jgi:hypothetical protein